MNVRRIARGGVVRIRTLEETKLAARWARSEGFSRRGALRGGSAAHRSRLGGSPLFALRSSPCYLTCRYECCVLLTEIETTCSGVDSTVHVYDAAVQ
jgi:hypothetical protein|eukprot:COSAG03_NODE_505_length_7365_cov_52.286402_2_plen_97_part_00